MTESLRLIQKGIRSIRVPQLLKCLNVSERQFERRFVRAIGVSPHHYIRIVRFQEAVRQMKANRFERLSDVAYNLNYVDQSHFIKDIKAFSGYTPTDLVEAVQAVSAFRARWSWHELVDRLPRRASATLPSPPQSRAVFHEGNRIAAR